jgi:hypothetical protein
MNAGPDAETDPSDAEVSELGTESLQESQEAIDRGHEAAREALNDEPDWTSGASKETPHADGETGDQAEQSATEAESDS